MPEMTGMVSGTLVLVGYYLICVVIAFAVRHLLVSSGRQPGEKFRKLLHLIQFNSILPLLFGFSVWWQPVFVELALLLIIYLLLLVLERWKPGAFGYIILERNPKEGYRSLCSSFGCFASLIAIFWGLYGEIGRMIVLLGVQTWGWSDLAAALIGKKYGRHSYPEVLYFHKKSMEGTLGDGVTSWLVALVVLMGCFGISSFWMAARISLILAIVSCISELLSPNGQDTWIVPGAVCLTALFLLVPDWYWIFQVAGGVDGYTIWICFLAGLGAGLGTGLCGLSAAAVIVPMLFSFLNVPAYQATGIALAADVLASLSSAVVYGRHHNINYKYGSIMLVSIALATIAGSLAATLVGNFALGSISIIVTICLGIKFIWKPIKSHTFAPEGKEERKKVIQSLVCGLGIGGLCGFVGTGGGTLMLIVLTAVIGFDLKMAVGTSVYIMSATALIGAGTHFMAGGIPDLWILLLCIGFTFVWAQIGAIFANRVSGKIMNRACGLVLLILGIAMLAMKILG